MYIYIPCSSKELSSLSKQRQLKQNIAKLRCYPISFTKFWSKSNIFYQRFLTMKSNDQKIQVKFYLELTSEFTSTGDLNAIRYRFVRKSHLLANCCILSRRRRGTL